MLLTTSTDGNTYIQLNRLFAGPARGVTGEVSSKCCCLPAQYQICLVRHGLVRLLKGTASSAYTAPSACLILTSCFLTHGCTTYLPEQFCSLGSSIYPVKQSHVNEPFEFIQFPFGAHGFVPLHTSLSVGSGDNMKL